MFKDGNQDHDGLQPDNRTISAPDYFGSLSLFMWKSPKGGLSGK